MYKRQVFGIGTVNAQNVLNEMAYGFETEVKEKPVNWWIVPAQRDKVMVTKDKACLLYTSRCV